MQRPPMSRGAVESHGPTVTPRSSQSKASGSSRAAPSSSATPPIATARDVDVASRFAGVCPRCVTLLLCHLNCVVFHVSVLSARKYQ